MYSSQSEKEREDDGSTLGKKGAGKKERSLPALVDTLGLCYLGLLLLRIPVVVGDLQRYFYSCALLLRFSLLLDGLPWRKSLIFGLFAMCH